MPTPSSTPVPTTRGFQLVEAVVERLDGAPVGERRRWSDEFKAQAVTAALEPGVNVSALARRLGISPPQLFGWRKAFLNKQGERVPGVRQPLVRNAWWAMSRSGSAPISVRQRCAGSFARCARHDPVWCDSLSGEPAG